MADGPGVPGETGPKPPTTVSSPPGSPTVPPGQTFTALDALKALRMSVGSLPADMTLDLDGDRQITSNDARLILGRIVR